MIVFLPVDLPPANKEHTRLLHNMQSCVVYIKPFTVLLAIDFSLITTSKDIVPVYGTTLLTRRPNYVYDKFDSIGDKNLIFENGLLLFRTFGSYLALAMAFPRYPAGVAVPPPDLLARLTTCRINLPPMGLLW